MKQHNFIVRSCHKSIHPNSTYEIKSFSVANSTCKNNEIFPHLAQLLPTDFFCAWLVSCLVIFPRLFIFNRFSTFQQIAFAKVSLLLLPSKFLLKTKPNFHIHQFHLKHLSLRRGITMHTTSCFGKSHLKKQWLAQKPKKEKRILPLSDH